MATASCCTNCSIRPLRHAAGWLVWLRVLKRKCVQAESYCCQKQRVGWLSCAQGWVSGVQLVYDPPPLFLARSRASAALASRQYCGHDHFTLPAHYCSLFLTDTHCLPRSEMCSDTPSFSSHRSPTACPTHPNANRRWEGCGRSRTPSTLQSL
jgi:hypothetical protein